MRILNRLLVTALLVVVLLALSSQALVQATDQASQCDSMLGVLERFKPGSYAYERVVKGIEKRGCGQALDHHALVTLYNSTHGASWLSDAGWLTDEPHCGWHGVRCGTDGRVSALYLHANQLSGPVPPELGNLSKLELFLAGWNELSGPIPRQLERLSNLEVLALHANQLSGPIPPELANLGNLLAISLSDNQLSGSIPPELGNLSNLQHLELHANQLSGPIPPELGDLSSLLWLHLRLNQLSGPIPPELGYLSNLIALYLGANQLEGPIPPELSGLSSLEFFSLSENDPSLCVSTQELQDFLLSVSYYQGPDSLCAP